MATKEVRETEDSPNNKEKAMSSNEDGAAADINGDGATSSTQPKKLSVGSRIWKVLGLDVGTVMLMFKGALPPTIALAAMTSPTWANKYTTLGYLVAIMATLGMCIMPRAKFLQTMIMNICGVCLGAALALLEMRCVTSARQHTSQPSATTTGSSGGQEAVRYNAAAATSSAVWLFFTIYISNVIRAKRPQLQFPIIIYSIFTIVASTYAQSFPTMDVSEKFVKRLLETFLTGFGIAAGVSLFVFPMTSRMIVEKQIAGFCGLLKGTLAAQMKYLATVSEARRAAEAGKMEPTVEQEKSNANQHHIHLHKKTHKETSDASKAQAKALKGSLFQISALFGKIHIEVGFAKKEMAYGYLGPDHYHKIIELSRATLLPILGMTSFIDILQSCKELSAADKAIIESEETSQAVRRLEHDEWEEVMALSHGQYDLLVHKMMDGLTHAIYVLKLAKPPKKKSKDVEANEEIQPGHVQWTATFEKKIDDFNQHRRRTLANWCGSKGITLPTSFWDNPSSHYSLKQHFGNQDSVRSRANQQQLYLMLYVDYLTWSVGSSILDFCRYADSLVEDGTLTKKRIIIPAWWRIKKWAQTALKSADTSEEGVDGAEVGSANVYAGDAFQSKKDPEHLPPTTLYEKVTHYLRAIPKFFASDESAFGFRVAVATMSLAILAFLRMTTHFFTEQRGIWAVIMTAISMAAHTGLGVWGYLCRIIGTAIAMLASMAIWYMCDEKIPAVMPVLYLYLVLGFWFILKQPRFVVVGIISIITCILVLGYQIQIHTIGLKVGTSNGQPFYPTYELAPYRLGAVCAGLGVAFFWTFFPYPVTTHSTLRKNLGTTMYLIANYYSCVHTTVEMRMKDGHDADEKREGSPANRLLKARQKVFSKCVIMLNQLREQSDFTKIEPKFGGKFPKATYDQLIGHLQNIFNYMSLVVYSSRTFLADNPENEEWVRDFRKFVSQINLTSHDMTSTLCLLSAAVRNGTPIPPYLKVPHPYDLADKMEAVDPELLSTKHVSEPCYASFAVLEIASTLVTEEIRHAIKLVQDLVGEVDFSFHIISTAGDDKSVSSSSTLLEKSSSHGSRSDANGKGKAD